MTSAGFFQVGQFRVLNFPIDLRQRFLAAHGQDGMPQRDENRDDAEHVRQTAVRQPAKGAGGKVQIFRMRPRAADGEWRTAMV